MTDRPRPVRLDAHEVLLRDGTRAAVRPIRPEDKWRLEEGLKQLSPRSRYLRFHTPVTHLSEEQLAYLTEVDQDRHVALVAIDADRPEGPGMGVARYIRLEDDPTVAEAAVTVLDTYQGRGVGSLLLQELMTAATAAGVRTFRNYVLAENSAMLEILDAAGGERSNIGNGVVQIDVPLPGAQDAPDDTGPQLMLRGIAAGEVPEVHWHFPFNAWLRNGPLAWMKQLVDDDDTGSDPA